MSMRAFTEIQKWSQLKKRIAIAKLRGIKPSHRWCFYYDTERQHGCVNLPTREVAVEVRESQVKWWGTNGGDITQISEVEEYDEWEYVAPYYTTDLNECHDLECSLTRPEHMKYRTNLEQVVNYNARYFCSATAEQRATAWLITKLII